MIALKCMFSAKINRSTYADIRFEELELGTERVSVLRRVRRISRLLARGPAIDLVRGEAS